MDDYDVQIKLTFWQHKETCRIKYQGAKPYVKI